MLTLLAARGLKLCALNGLPGAHGLFYTKKQDIIVGFGSRSIASRDVNTATTA
jgi:hypothetical protein